MPFVLGITLGHTIVLGLPLLAFLASKQRLTAFRCGLAGFVVGCAPATFMWVVTLGGNNQASTNGVPTIVDGFPTFAGLLHFGAFFLYLGAYGGLAGLTYWVFSQLPTLCLKMAKGKSRLTMPFSVASLAMALTLTGVVFIGVPSATKDRTCHNMFRDGRTSIGPQVRIDLDISMAEWPHLAALFEEFGASRDLSFRNSSGRRSDAVELLYLSLCNDLGTNVKVGEQRWADHNFENLMKGWGVGVIVYEQQDGSDWTAVTRNLVRALETVWPGKVRFRDSMGRLTPPPAEMMEGD